MVNNREKVFFKKIKAILAVLIMPLLFIPVLINTPAFADKVQSEPMDIGIDAGFNNSYIVNGWIPFRITVESREDSFTGEIQVIPNTNTPYQTAYAAPINLPAFSKKEIEFSVFSNIIQKQMTVQIVKGGKTVMEKDFDFDRQLSPTVPVAGVLSDSFASFQYLNGMKLFDNAREGMELTQLQPKTFPNERKVLDSFDAIIISNFDTSTLDNEQKDLLLQWVEDGGVLVLGTGPNSKKVMNTLPDTLKSVELSGGTIGDAGAAQEALNALEKYTSKKFPGNDKITLADLSIRRGASLVSVGSKTILAEERHGNGEVITMAFDPVLQPITDWAGNQAMWKNIFSVNTSSRINQKQQTAMGMPVGRPMGGFYGPLNIPSDEMPSVWWIMIVLGIYILIVGPVNYLILKKLDKREWMWVSVPAISVLVVSIIYVSGFRTRFTGPILSSTSVVRVSAGSLRAAVSSNVQLTSPFKGVLKLDFSKGTELTPNGDSYYGPRSYVDPGQKAKDGKVVVRMIKAEADSIEYLNMQTWGSQNFTLNKDLTLEGSLFEEITIDKEELLIKVNNRTGMEYKDACLRIGNNYIDLGDIGTGEAKELRVALDPSLRTDFYSYLNNKFGQNTGRVQGQKVTREQQEAFRRRQILESNYNFVQEINMNRSGEAIFFGWNRDLLDNQVTSGKMPVKLYNTNLFVMNIPYGFKKSGEVHILPGFIKPELNPGDYSLNPKMIGRQPGGDSVIVRNDGDVIFSFKIPDYITPAKVQVLWDSNTVPGYGKPVMPGQTAQSPNAKLFIQNQQTKGWEEISAVYNINNDISKYMTSDSQILLKAEVKIDRNIYPEAFVRYPDIDISGVVK